MFGRMDYLDAIDDPACLVRRERFIERAKTVRVKIVHHKRDSFRAGEVNIHELPNFMSPIDSRSLVGHCDMPPAGQRFGEGEDVCRPVPLVFAVVALGSPRSGFQWRSYLDGQLFAQLIHAD